ncbi:MAG: UDP-N-acetylmuramate--L-alanine ligase [Alphaproteobacteria bacterium]|nr:UDP-N-acetylmuramate--L-alanine ligase [Alphaproteobacteria bacterium]
MVLSFKNVHFIGIGGIGMSGVAEMLQAEGVKVQGSNDKENDNTKRLCALGVDVMIGHDSNNLKDADCVVISTATVNNIEVTAAKNKNIPVMHRAEMLAELLKLKQSICVAGTHGKTTTSSLIACMLSEAKMQPSFIIGGILNAYKSNAHVGSGDWIVAEADESDGSFLRLPSSISVVTNIDPEHLDYYKTFENEKQAFLTFLNQTTGFNVVCLDPPVIKEILPCVQGKEVISYGLDSSANVMACNIQTTFNGTQFDVQVKLNQDERIIKDVILNMLGMHNIQNALAAVAVAVRLGISDDVIKQTLASFQGVQRRLSLRGMTKQNVPIYDDYAHHPNEIRASLAALKAQTKGRLIAVWQPHRWTRFSNLYQDFLQAFDAADMVGVTDVYAAGESPLQTVSVEAFVMEMQKNKPAFKTSVETLAEDLKDKIEPNDCVVCLGAGSISGAARELPLLLGGKKYE